MVSCVVRCDVKVIWVEWFQAPLTDDEMNALGAKILRAELMGNDEMVTELKLKLENARKARTSGVKTHKESEKVTISGVYLLL